MGPPHVKFLLSVPTKASLALISPVFIPDSVIMARRKNVPLDGEASL